MIKGIDTTYTMCYYASMAQRIRCVKYGKGRVMKNTALKNAREKCGLTQVQIADKAAISEVSYQRIERGAQEPGVHTAILISDALGVKSYEQFKALFGAGVSNDT